MDDAGNQGLVGHAFLNGLDLDLMVVPLREPEVDAFVFFVIGGI